MTMRPGLEEEVLSFWFGERGSLKSRPALVKRVQELWFGGGEEVDSEIARRFKADLDSLAEGDLGGAKTTKEKLALIVLLDQFSRNIYRESPRAFAQDPRALKLTNGIIEAGRDKKLEPEERAFVYLVLEHSEDADDQALSVSKFEELAGVVAEELKSVYESFLDYAVQHKVIIDRFGRFPHRNELLGRASTPEEIEFLKQPGSSF